MNTNEKINLASQASLILAGKIRLDVIEMVCRARASHIGSCFSVVDALAVLYGRILRFNVENVTWVNRDRFILSKGHAAAALYATLAQVGILPKHALKDYGNDGSNFMTHASHKVPGIEFSSGSLGHGLPFGVGRALAAKKLGQRWRTFVMLSDGELNEGSNWEAMMFAAHHRLDNLVGLVDYNKLQSLASVSETITLEPLTAKFAAFGWAVREIDGHDYNALESNLNSTPWEPNKPSVLVMHTVKGKGVSYMENRVDWHYRTPSPEQAKQAAAEIKKYYA